MLTTLPPSCADFLKILGASASYRPRGLSRPIQGYLYLVSSSEVCSEAVGCDTALQAGRSSRFPTESLGFLLPLSIRPYYGPTVDSSSNIKEYQKYLLRVKAAGA